MKDALVIRLALAHPEDHPVRDDGRLSERAELAIVMSKICKWLAQHAAVSFEVSGFGQAKWPVDVSVDLAVVAEHVPDVLEALRRRQTVDLDFYEQGVQRLVTFEPAGEHELRVSCQSGTEWVPSPEYLASSHDVIEMLVALGKTFVNLAEARCPGPVKHVRFQAWLGRFTKSIAGLRESSPS